MIRECYEKSGLYFLAMAMFIFSACKLEPLIAVQKINDQQLRAVSSEWIPDSIFLQSKFPWNDLLGQWGRESLRTVTGRGHGTWRNFEKEGEKLIMWEKNYHYHGANWHLEEVSAIDSLIQKHEVEKHGALLYYGNHRMTMALIDSLLIENAIIPNGNLEWIYANDEISFRYKFLDDPFQETSGTVIVWRDYQREKESFIDTLSFQTLDTPEALRIQFNSTYQKFSMFPLTDLYFIHKFSSGKLASFSPNIEAFIYSRNGYYWGKKSIENYIIHD